MLAANLTAPRQQPWYREAGSGLSGATNIRFGRTYGTWSR